MRTFWRLTAISMQSQLYYRTSFLLNLLSPIVLLFGQYLLWAALYEQQGGAAIGGMEQREMFSYILLAFAMSNLLNWAGENRLSREIKTGQVAARCVRPAAFLTQYLAEMLGALLIQGAVNLLVVFAGFVCFGKYMTVPSISVLPRFIPCLILAVTLRLMMIDVFSLLCFFTTGYLGISWTRAALFDFFSGAMIPVALFPEWLKAIACRTPFPYMLQAPVAVLLGQDTLVGLPAVYGLQLVWILIFLGLHGLIYGLARRNLTIAGG